jgi:hypothetical protein
VRISSSLEGSTAMAHLPRRAVLVVSSILAAAVALVTVAVPAVSAGTATTVPTKSTVNHTIVWNPGMLLPAHSYEIDFTTTTSAARDLVTANVVSSDAAGHVLGSTKGSVSTVSSRLREGVVVVTIPDGTVTTVVTFTAVYGTPTATDQWVTELALMS